MAATTVAQKGEAEILYQKFFKSAGPRTYAAQVKKAANGSHFLVLTEGKRDAETQQVKKTRVFVFHEDFPAFFDMLKEARDWTQKNPVPAEVLQRRQKYLKSHAAAPK